MPCSYCYPLAACGGNDAEPTATNPESTEEAAPVSGGDGEDISDIPDLDLGDGSYELSPDVPEPDPAEDAPERYRAIVSQADIYEYGEPIDGADISYQYALVQMKQGDTVPALLVEQLVEDNIIKYP